MKRVKTLVMLCFIFLLPDEALSQDINIAWRRMLDWSIDPVRIESGHYDYRPFQMIDILVEKPLENEWLSVGGEFCYGNYHPYRSSVSVLYGKEKDYYDRSYALGVFARVYTRPRVFRLFAQLTPFVNYIQIHQPIEIKHDFGVYLGTVDHEQWVFSQTLAVGFSLGGKRLRWEPYFQGGIASPISESWRGSFVLASTGALNISGTSQWESTFIVVPLAIKIGLDFNKKSTL